MTWAMVYGLAGGLAGVVVGGVFIFVILTL